MVVLGFGGFVGLDLILSGLMAVGVLCLVGFDLAICYSVQFWVCLVCGDFLGLGWCCSLVCFCLVVVHG